LGLCCLKPATRPNSCINSRTLFVLDSGSCSVKTRSSAKAFSLYCFTPTCIPCTNRSSLIMFKSTSRTEMNKRGDKGHPCRVPFLSKAFSASIKINTALVLIFACKSSRISTMFLVLSNKCLPGRKPAWSL
uniref:Uncharacterized protein n=1 Tax=Podarcis muralis TaxID=64176 RepID=A0A670JIN0_PODMU